MAKRYPKIGALLLGGAAWCFLTTGATGQQDDSRYTIRVESDQVLVRALPLEKPSRNAPPSAPQDLDGHRVIWGLTAKDFHLYQDGVEQAIQSVAFEPDSYRIVRDSAACHMEDFRVPEVRWMAGRWRFSNCPDQLVNAYTYEIAFRPPPSPPGSCHRIALTVDRPNAIVYNRDAYCSTTYSVSDPVSATPEGRRLESELDSDSAGKLTLSLQAGYFFTEEKSPRMHIALELPWNSFTAQWKKNSLWAFLKLLGIIYGRDGSLAWRFSDNEGFSVDAPFEGESPQQMQSDPDYLSSLATRYERQIDLSPGEYDLRIVFSDGVNYGRATTPLVVDSFDEKQLNISSVMLASRFQQAPAPPPGGGPALLPGGFVPLVSQNIEVTPSGSTEFKRGEPLIAYFEVYPPVAATPDTKVTIHLGIVDAKTGQVRDGFEPFDATQFQRPDGNVFAIARKLPTKKLKKGAYRLEVQATDSAGRATVVRPATFTIQ
jgi:hypothetical protein